MAIPRTWTLSYTDMEINKWKMLLETAIPILKDQRQVAARCKTLKQAHHLATPKISIPIKKKKKELHALLTEDNGLINWL